MKKIVVTQRIYFIENRKEKNAALDISLLNFLSDLDFLLFPLPILNFNLLKLGKNIFKWLKEINPNGFIISGGNDIGEYVERDAIERFIIMYGIKYEIPLFGICRGMQILLNFFSVPLVKIEGHVNRQHYIHGQINMKVNSFHNYGFFNLPKDFSILALSSDGVVESFKHDKLKIMGIMWHPERESVYNEIDKNLILNFFNSV